MIDGLSFQLYSARNFPPLDAQFATLAELGYNKVEPYGALLETAPDLAGELRRHGLTAPSCHVGLDALTSDMDGAVAAARSIGVSLLVVPFIPPDRRAGDAAGWRDLGATLAGLQDAVAGHGLGLAWHNHDFEFRPLADGSVPMALLLDTAPGLLWELDIGWVVRAGEDPAAWIERYRDRIAAFHLKDLAPDGDNADEDGWADVGEGIIDWPSLLPTIMLTNADLFIVEHDNPADFARFARRSRAAVAGWNGGAA